MRLFHRPDFSPFSLPLDGVPERTINQIYFEMYWKVHVALSPLKRYKDSKLGPMTNGFDVRGDAQ